MIQNNYDEASIDHKQRTHTQRGQEESAEGKRKNAVQYLRKEELRRYHKERNNEAKNAIAMTGDYRNPIMKEAANYKDIETDRIRKPKDDVMGQISKLAR